MTWSGAVYVHSFWLNHLKKTDDCYPREQTRTETDAIWTCFAVHRFGEDLILQSKDHNSHHVTWTLPFAGGTVPQLLTTDCDSNRFWGCGQACIFHVFWWIWVLSVPLELFSTNWVTVQWTPTLWFHWTHHLKCIARWQMVLAPAQSLWWPGSFTNY